MQPGINLWVLRDATGTTLVDTGLDAPGLVRALRRIGVDPAEVGSVLLTHGHPDHAGGLARLRAAGARPSVRVGEGDLAVVRGTAPPAPRDPRSRLGRLLDRLPPAPRFGPPPPTPGARPLRHGERLDVAGGIEVVATPGHSPGHLAFHLPAHDLVLGGDVVFNYFTLRPSPGFLCSDLATNHRSVTTIAGLAPTTLGLAHGAPVRGDVAGRLRQLVAER